MKDFWENTILSGELNPHQIQEAYTMLFDPHGDTETKAHFLRVLHRRGETPKEMALFAEELLKKSTNPFPRPPSSAAAPILDIVGTGGDYLGLFNISTTVMFVAAACGAVVVKSGNRKISSSSGAADVLEALQVDIHFPPEKVPAVVESVGCVFLFAPLYYPIFGAIAETRSLLAQEGSRTLFNFLGPLTNPARPSHQLVGLYEPTLLKKYADALELLGRKSAWVLSGVAGTESAGMDEVSTLGETTVCSLRQGKKNIFQIDPTQFGLPLARQEDLLGGDAQENARILVNILNGSDRGPRRDIVLLNTAAALCVCEIASDLSHGIQLAKTALTSGEALRRLESLIELSAH